MGISWQPGILRIAAVVYDERYSDCRSFADILVQHGATPFPANGDCGRLWHGALSEHFAANRGSVAGLTTDSDSVVSRVCGREFGFSTTYEGTHDGRGPGYIVHHLRGSGYERDFASTLQRDEMPWSESVAEALHRSVRLDNPKSGVQRTMLNTRNSLSQHLYLVSWLLEKSA